MELKSLVCPHCGANTTNVQNCEYCGSLLVRFVDKGIDISNTSYLSGTCEYPGLLAELKNNLKLQAENPSECVFTDIFWETAGDIINSVSIGSSGRLIWRDNSDINLGSKGGGLIILESFDTYVGKDEIELEEVKYFNQKMDRQLSKFKQLKSFPLFTSHFSSYADADGFKRFCRGYAIDFGKDAEGAATLISEILLEVEGLKPTDNYDIMTNVGDAVDYARDAWYRTHEPESSDSTNDVLKLVFYIIGFIIFIILFLFF